MALIFVLTSSAIAGSVPFTVPFDTTFYSGGFIQGISDSGTSGAVAYWKIQGGELFVGMAGNVAGFVGFGLNDNQPGMPGADIYLCRKDSQGNVTVSDMYAPRFDVPLYDDHQDAVTLASGRANGVTWCQFKRPLLTCDSDNVDYQIKDPATSIYGLLSWRNDDQLAYHGNGNRRTQSFSFAQQAMPPYPSDARSFTLSAPSDNVLTVPGSYLCSYHMLPLPEPSRKYQIIQYSLKRSGPAVDAGVLHHVNVNACTRPIVGVIDGAPINCDIAMSTCSQTLLNGGYAPEGTVLPADTGIPIGGINGTLYVIVSRHFYNPALKSGLNDPGTSYNITITATLRPKEVFIVSLGVTQFVIPPNSYRYPVTAYCSSQCTQRFGAAGVTVTSVFFHMHGHGKRAAVRVIRNNVELEPIAVADPFDAASSSINVNRVVAPGDVLLLDCIYDNDSPTNNITYGSTLDQEMCFGFLSVVGASSITGCLDLPWGLEGVVVPQCANYTYLDVCNFTKARNYCPDQSGSTTNSTVINERERAVAYTPYVPTAPAPCSVGNNVPVTVPAVPGKCSLYPITGSIGGPFGTLIDQRIYWTTFCANSTIKFEIQARIGSVGWIGFGLHPAGTASAPIPLPATRMRLADIIQVSASSNALVDRTGPDGYGLPVAKSSSVARLIETSFVNGYMRAVFDRPFASSSGLTLVETDFVWIITSYNAGSDNFDVKHVEAHPILTRVSFFDGKAESVTYVATPGSTQTPTTSAAQTPTTSAAQTPTNSMGQTPTTPLIDSDTASRCLPFALALALALVSVLS